LLCAKRSLEFPMTSITATQGVTAPAAQAKANDPTADSNLFASLLNGATQTASPSAAASSGSAFAPSTQSALLQLQETGGGAGMGPPTALSGLGGTIDPASERQTLQQFGASFAQSMDTNGDGTVTESELVDKLHDNGGLDPALGQRLYGILSPNNAPMTVAQMAASATSVFAPPWLTPSAG
jgi:hypothetical protein